MQESKKIKAGQPIICQLMSFIPEQVFTKALESTQANHYYKKMLAKDHFLWFKLFIPNMEFLYVILLKGCEVI